ncbi:MAG: hypothetical protein CFE44_28675, partial [Burkholderiales bacterium PBB4]
MLRDAKFITGDSMRKTANVKRVDPRARMRAQARFPFILAPVALAISASAIAAPIGSDPEVEMNFDNTFSYSLGFRAKEIDPKIGDNPIYQNSDYKFSDRGDVVTNRVGFLSEFDINVRNKYGGRVSASAWKDFAYDDEVRSNPGSLLPGV